MRLPPLSPATGHKSHRQSRQLTRPYFPSRSAKARSRCICGRSSHPLALHKHRCRPRCAKPAPSPPNFALHKSHAVLSTLRKVLGQPRAFHSFNPWLDLRKMGSIHRFAQAYFAVRDTQRSGVTPPPPPHSRRSHSRRRLLCEPSGATRPPSHLAQGRPRCRPQ